MGTGHCQGGSYTRQVASVRLYLSHLRFLREGLRHTETEPFFYVISEPELNEDPCIVPTKWGTAVSPSYGDIPSTCWSIFPRSVH